MRRMLPGSSRLLERQPRRWTLPGSTANELLRWRRAFGDEASSLGGGDDAADVRILDVIEHLTRPVSVLPSSTLNQAMERLVSDRVGSCLASSEIGEVKGVFTARDILKKMVQQGNSDKDKAEALRCEVGAANTPLRPHHRRQPHRRRQPRHLHHLTNPATSTSRTMPYRHRRGHRTQVSDIMTPAVQMFYTTPEDTLKQV